MLAVVKKDIWDLVHAIRSSKDAPESREEDD